MVKTITEPSVSAQLGLKADEEDWQHPRLLKSGETDGFKWYVGEYHLPFSSFHTLSTIRVAYIDVTGTKLDGVTDTATIDHAKIDLYCGCTFTGSGEMAALLKHEVQSSQSRWYIGEDYAHDLNVLMHKDGEETVKLDSIVSHLKNETIPSIIKALVEIDIANPDFDGQTI